MNARKLGLLAVLALAAVPTMSAQSLEQRRADFSKLKFGMFIHFNMGTFHEQEWVLPGRDPTTFNPVKLDCGQWADAAKRAGMNYAVLTTKHHDGFCLWDSQTTTYDVAASPLKGRDIVREYCDAFRQRGIEPHFYFSIWDRQLGIEKQITPEEISIIKAQLTELLTHYGKIGSLTFDGWGNCGTEWTQADRDVIYAHVKSLQPQILVTDHFQLRRKLPLKEVYQVVDFFHYEEPIGEWAPAGNVFVSQQGPTLQSAWFWKLKFPSEGLMSVDDIVEKHLKVLNTRNCNFLLNCAPNRDGLLDENVVRRLAEVGKAWQPGDSGNHAWGDWQAWGDQGNGTYRNPVLPADYSDIDCIRVGADYYAISSTFQYSPGMVILHSKDLVNWTIAGHAVTDLTQIGPELNWDRMDRFGRGIWAGAIRHHAGKFWVYFGTPDEGYFMTTATNVAGPWSPLTHVLKARGWDDCCPFWDDDGQGYLIGSQFDKDPVNGKKYNIHLWKLSADGKSLVTESDKILYQSNGSEANKLYKWNGTYYHYFSEVRAEGRVPMMGRATNITGPYEYRQIGHVKKGVDYEPNQGGIVQSEAGDWWFFTHHGSGDWSGRIASLLPVTWTNGWPIIGEPGADGIGNMVWSARKPVKNSPRITPQTDDEFSSATLSPQWEWHYQPRVGKWSLTERSGFLRLHAFKGLHGDNLLKVGNVLTQRPLRTSTNMVTVKMEVAGMADGQSAGLFHYTTAGYAGIGVSQSNGVRRLVYRSGPARETGPHVSGNSVWLRSSWGLDGVCRFSQSLDGKTFEPVGEPYQMKWASYRGDRIGLFNYSNAAAAGYVDFDSFHYEYTGQAGAADASDTLDLGARGQPVPPDARFSQPGYFVWCGAPVRGADGKYHLFYSRWPVKNGFHPGWAIHSEIAYAVSDQPHGPYHFVNVALPARGTNAATRQKFWDADMTHNPNIVVRDGKYLLYYIGNYGDGKYETHRNNDRIGVAIADKPEGPWRRLDQPIIDVSADATAFDSLCVANPAAAVRPDGGLIVIYKAVPIVPGKVMGGNVRYGVAVADKPEGPYVKQPGRVFEGEGAEAKKHWMLAEDPYIWFSRKYGNRYYAVARDVVGKFTGASGGLALFESVDGFHWQAAAHPKVLGARFSWADGAPSHQNVERPALLFDGEEPIALFGATDGYQKNGRISFNVQIPLKLQP